MPQTTREGDADRAARERLAAWLLSDDPHADSIPEVDEDSPNGGTVPHYSLWDKIGPSLRVLSGMPASRRARPIGAYLACSVAFARRAAAVSPSRSARSAAIEAEPWPWKSLSDTLRSYDPDSFRDAYHAVRRIVAGADVEAVLRAWSVMVERRPTPTWALCVTHQGAYFCGRGSYTCVDDLDAFDRKRVFVAANGVRYYLPSADDQRWTCRKEWGPAWDAVPATVSPAGLRAGLEAVLGRVNNLVHRCVGGKIDYKVEQIVGENLAAPIVMPDAAGLAEAWRRAGRILMATGRDAEEVVTWRKAVVTADEDHIATTSASERAAVRWGAANVITGGANVAPPT